MKTKYFIVFGLILTFSFIISCEEEGDDDDDSAGADYNGIWSFTFSNTSGDGPDGDFNFELSQSDEIAGFYYVNGIFNSNLYQFNGTLNGSSLTDVRIFDLDYIGDDDEWMLTGSFSDTSMSGNYEGDA